MHPMLNIAIRAARAGGTVIVRHVDRVDTVVVTEKARNDFVSDVDRMAEEVIIDTILRSYPQHGILAEESGARGDSEYQWVIDPLDGTTNFLHGLPHYCVSVALLHRGRLDQAVVFDPISQELFTATRGGGAQMDNKRIRASQRKGLKHALLGTGSPIRQLKHLDSFMASLAAVIPHTAGVRRTGSAALDLAYVAAGRLDGFWEFGLAPWDIAAGALLVREAGGIVTDCEGGENYMDSGNIIAAGPKVVAELGALIQPHARRRQLEQNA
jgi:myo-inositol-1(or 4)-monophosphatase